MAAIRAALNEAWDVEERGRSCTASSSTSALVFLVAAGLALLARRDGGAALRRPTSSRAAGWIAWCRPRRAAARRLRRAALPLPRRPGGGGARADTWPAALLSAALVAAENLFAFYVGHFAHYNAVYGSLGAVIAFMFFVYLSSQIFLLGAEVASEWPRVRAALERGEEPPPRTPARAAVRGLWVRAPRAAATDAGAVRSDSEREETPEATRGRSRRAGADRQAAEVIKGIVDESEAGPEGGLRITGTAEEDGEASLEFSVAPGPVEGDEVVEAGGATVFLDEVAASVLEDKKLDVEAHGDHYHFSLGDQERLAASLGQDVGAPGGTSPSRAASYRRRLRRPRSRDGSAAAGGRRRSHRRTARR